MMKLGLFVNGGGHHIAAWRHPGVARGASQNFAHYAEIARTGERGRFDMLFTADSASAFGPDDVGVWQRTQAVSKLEPLTLLSALSAITTRIGLVTTVTTTYTEPYQIARFFASLDKISSGRAGWNLVTSASPTEALNFSRDAHPPHAERYERAAEHARVVLGLWDTWEDDAHIEDKEAGISFDAAKLHFLNHTGKYFSVRGPMTVARSPQGRPVIVQAGQSEPGRELAAETAEVIFTVQQDFGRAREFYADIKERVARFGRPPEAIKVMPGVVPVVGATKSEAEEKFEELQALIHPELGVAILSDLAGIDLTGYPLDGPLPDAPPTNAQLGRQKLVYDLARRENLTIRQLYLRVAGARAHRFVCGTVKDICDSLEQWYREGAADGFNIMPQTFPAGLNDFVEQVIPELQRRDLFRTEYEGKTLRENLGLPYPETRWALERTREAGE